MRNRFFKVIYVVLHIPLAIYLIQLLVFNKAWSYVNEITYRVDCLTNNKPVVLVGTIDNTPVTYTNTFLKTYPDTYQQMGFYCKYHNEVTALNKKYYKTLTEKDRIEVNLATEKLKNTNPTVYEKNYQLVELKRELNLFPLVTDILFGSLIGLGYYIFLVTLKIFYQYIVTGKFTIHPYK